MRSIAPLTRLTAASALVTACLIPSMATAAIVPTPPETGCPSGWPLLSLNDLEDQGYIFGPELDANADRYICGKQLAAPVQEHFCATSLTACVPSRSSTTSATTTSSGTDARQQVPRQSGAGVTHAHRQAVDSWRELAYSREPGFPS